MYGIVFRVEVKPTKREDFIQFIKWDAHVAREREPGTLQFELYQDPKNENGFYVYEAHRDLAAFEAHKRNQPHRDWVAKIRPEMVDVFEQLFEGDALRSLSEERAAITEDATRVETTRMMERLKERRLDHRNQPFNERSCTMDLLNWTDKQQADVASVIADEVGKARLSHYIIDSSKPELSRDARNVCAERYDKAKNTVDDVATIPLVEVTAPVILTPAQALDEHLSSALLLIRRAANKLARAHDEIVFTGQPNAGELPPKAKALLLKAKWGSANKGLFETANEAPVKPLIDQTIGEALVGAVAKALVKLEDAGYIGSYVLILGQTLFTEANTPSKGSMVLPSDRMKNLMELEPDQHIHRSSVLEDDTGLLLSLGGQPMDRAIAIPPSFEFLRIGEDQMRECRVYERFALRLKEPDSVVKLRLKP